MAHNINKLRFDSIMPDIKVTAKKQVIKLMAEHTSQLIGTPANELYDALMEQEKSGSSGVGHRVAIPHMKLPRLTKPLIIFTRLKHEIDFDSNDDNPVDLVCLVLSPSFEGAKHLQRLAMVTRTLNDKSFCEKLRHAENDDEIRHALNVMNDRRMAA